MGQKQKCYSYNFVQCRSDSLLVWCWKSQKRRPGDLDVSSTGFFIENVLSKSRPTKASLTQPMSQVSVL